MRLQVSMDHQMARINMTSAAWGSPIVVSLLQTAQKFIALIPRSTRNVNFARRARKRRYGDICLCEAVPQDHLTNNTHRHSTFMADLRAILQNFTRLATNY